MSVQVFVKMWDKNDNETFFVHNIKKGDKNYGKASNRIHRKRTKETLHSVQNEGFGSRSLRYLLKTYCAWFVEVARKAQSYYRGGGVK
jgi:hypothetical protein